MAIYAMGDLHGCYREFKKLLEKIKFDHAHDRLYLVGDMINRGPKSTKVLKYLLKHQDSIFPVLGNHDLAFLVYQAGLIRLKRHDTYGELLESKHIDEFVAYIRHLPLMHYLSELDITICHAGIHPKWDIEKAQSLAKEAEAIFKDDKRCADFLPKMFGNVPDYWSDALEGDDRIRSIINVFSRMRYLHPDTSLDFDAKVPLKQVSTELIPWFRFPHQLKNTQVIFGHWGALGLHQENNVYCIDSGCAWGGKLTAIRLDAEPQTLFHQKGKHQ